MLTSVLGLCSRIIATVRRIFYLSYVLIAFLWSLYLLGRLEKRIAKVKLRSEMKIIELRMMEIVDNFRQRLERLKGVRNDTSNTKI